MDSSLNHRATGIDDATDAKLEPERGIDDQNPDHRN